MPEDKDLASIAEARNLARRAAAAQAWLERLSQELVDGIVAAMAAAAGENSRRLARMAWEETGFGNPDDKHIKNSIAYRDVHNHIKGMRTVGILARDEERKVVEIAAPMGVVAAIIPSTNPTSTAIYKLLICIKARNAVVVSPHPAAQGCIAETVRVMSEAGKAAGLPDDAILCMKNVTLEGTRELMRLKEIALIIATGGMGLVKAAYSSGKPAFGVGPGNVPAYVHPSADIAKAARDILAGKCFDHGTVCASEQAVVVDREAAPRLRDEMNRNGAYFLSESEAQAVAGVLVGADLHVNPKLVGKPAEEIAAAASIDVPPGTRCLIATLDAVGPSEPLSIEKLSPVLAWYEVSDWHEGCERCKEILRFGGMGHTLAIHCNEEEIVTAFGMEKPASRICVNTPASYGAVGYSTSLPPSLTLGCGAAGNNITSDNITPLHLLDIKRIAYETREVIPAWSEAAETVGGENMESLPSPSTSDRRALEKLVDEFLDQRNACSVKPQPSAAPQAGIEELPASEADDEVRKTPAAAPHTPAAPLPPPPKPVDFVSEWEVRQALRNGESILIHDKTIITPLARELGEREGVFVKP
ncbi:MAG TPA: aldehyde dehydrogenase family protein [Acidobacteriota bacterium]|nr:aldehyde dehydrogenase family protein [Acidobacteriota bacterium]